MTKNSLKRKRQTGEENELPKEKIELPPAKRMSDEPTPKKVLYTMGELKMTGNCLKGTRPLLSFDENFGTKPHYSLLKELLTQIFGVPNHHPKSQPFFDHVYTFSILDNRIWFRNYQILTEDGGLAEIGPRFVLNPVKIFAGSFGGETIWDNPTYISPAKFRQAFKKRAAGKYENRIDQKMAQKANKPEVIWALNPTQEIFKGDVLSKAAELEVEDATVEEKKVTPKAKKFKQKFSLKKLSERSVNKKKLGKTLKKKKKVVKKVKSQGN
ncbi:ribosome biogenesis protein BRX1 homolog [Belonocnema kinseyi]|uniref:ribosome biogenesis protein BRX1 homolog n=1 Tax=Belonocnema kinseyi TaxID=2817044 RepID=UPI00143DD975|nr:ribosome biogenesis protein BRX1 homolog [Belonocnema kinseyi]